MPAVDGLRGFHVVQTSPTDATLMILAVDADTLDRIATEVGSVDAPERRIPAGGPPHRHIGPVLTSI
jgi:hypothetical protein